MTGISEILVLILLIVCILILPRMLKGVPAKRSTPVIKKLKLKTKTRLGIVLTVLYPIAAVLYFAPWATQNYIPFVSFGILPVVLVWGIVWIFAGKKK